VLVLVLDPQWRKTKKERKDDHEHDWEVFPPFTALGDVGRPSPILQLLNSCNS
jgi:hypothetical protein